MKVIQTTFIPATATEPAYIRAWTETTENNYHAHVIPYDETMGEAGSHYTTAFKLQDKLGWECDYLVSGKLPSGDWAHIGQYDND